jgi:hypothetical protein
LDDEIFLGVSAAVRRFETWWMCIYMTRLIEWNDIAFKELETETHRSLTAEKQAPYLKRYLLGQMQEAAKLGGSTLASLSNASA